MGSYTPGTGSNAAPKSELQPVIQGNARSLLVDAQLLNGRLECILQRLRGPSAPNGGINPAPTPAELPLDDVIRHHIEEQRRTFELLQELDEYV